MPQNYRLAESGCESEYESEDGTKYFPVKKLNDGSFASARKFKSVDLRAKAVLKPVNPSDISFSEVGRKHHFFKTIYPDQEVTLFSSKNNYRLVLPFIPGIEYKKYPCSLLTLDQQVLLFLSAIEALEQAHNKNLVLIDLHENNILFDESTHRSYLIDGGLAVRENEAVPESIFLCSSVDDVSLGKSQYEQIAPECWSTHQSVRANKRMDIFSLGSMMNRILSFPYKRISYLANLCINPDPNSRPNLSELKNKLHNLLAKKKYEGAYSKGRLLNKVCSHIQNSIPTVGGLHDKDILFEIAVHHLFAKAARGQLNAVSFPIGVKAYVHNNCLIISEGIDAVEQWSLDQFKSSQYLIHVAAARARVTHEFYKSQETLTSYYKNKFISTYNINDSLTSYMAFRKEAVSLLITPYWEKGVKNKELVAAINIIKNYDVNLKFKELRLLQGNKKLQLAITHYMNQCRSLNFNAYPLKNEALEHYIMSAIKYALQGSAEFNKKYPGLMRLSIQSIDHQWFTQVAHDFFKGINGAFEVKSDINKHAMSSSRQSRSGFFYGKSLNQPNIAFGFYRRY